MPPFREPGERPGASPHVNSRLSLRPVAAVAAFALALGSCVSAGRAQQPAAAPVPEFDDEVCPQANPAGRALNALDAGGSTDNDGIVYAAQGLIDAYHDCAFRYDRAYKHGAEPDPEDRAFVHRVYARLELALAYQRVGMLAEQLREPDAARAQYDGARQAIDDLERVVARCPLLGGSTAGKLVAQARDLEVAIVQVEAELKPGAGASAAPQSE